MKQKNLSLVLPELRPLLMEFDNIYLDIDAVFALREQREAQRKECLTEDIDKVKIEEHHINSYDKAKIRLKLYIPDDNSSNKPALFYVHGGGYLFGNIEDEDARHKYLCQKFNLVIIGVEYRLSPENKYPVPQEDCYSALSWVYKNSTSFGIDETKIMAWGNSAGGGIVAGLTLMMRDRKEFKVSHQFLIYPMLDDRTCIKTSFYPQAGDFVWTPQSNIFAWNSMLGIEPGSKNVSSYAAAARELDLSNLPNTFISVGSIDLFLEEDINYAKKLIECGVPTELHIYPGCFHGFDMLVEKSEIKTKWRSDFDNALKRAIVSL